MTSPALVLHTRKYSDDRLIVETYTEAAGAASFIVRISHGGRKGNVPHTLFQPLALLSISWDEHTRSTLLKPTAAHLLTAQYTPVPEKAPEGQTPDPLPLTHYPLPLTHYPLPLTLGPVKSALSLFLAEFFRGVLRQEPPSPPIFRYIAGAVQWLNIADGRSLANVHLAILIRMANLLGIRPSAEELLPICPAAHREAIPTLLRMNLANQHLYKFTRAQRAEILSIILLYYKQHIPAFPEIKSVEVLSQIFV